MGFFVGMDSFTRMFAAKNEKPARNGTILAALFLIPLAVGTVWLGMTAALLYPGVENSNDILSKLVMDIFPVGLKGLMLVGILAALMSTADICILTAAANGSRDIYQRYVNPEVAPQRLFRISMITAALVGLAAAFMAWKMQDVVEIILVAFTVNAAGLFIPTIALVAMKNVNTTAAFWSVALTLVTVIAWYSAAALGVGSVFEIDPLWPGLAVSAVTFGGISLLSSSQE
jgi:SSS family solute:Na+ symporter